MSTTGLIVQQPKRRRFTSEDVMLMRELFDHHGMPLRVIAEKFETNISTVWAIVRRKTYIDVR